MGGGLDPHIEAVVAAKPDLVLMAESAPAVARLRGLGLKVLALEPKDKAQAIAVLKTIDQALGTGKAAAVLQGIESGIAAAAAAVPLGAKGKRVYFEVSPVPYAAGEASFIGQTLKHLGLVNIIDASLGPFPKINPEFVVRARPDIVMVSENTHAELRARPGWANLAAVRNDVICKFDQEASDMLVRPGPRMDEAAKLVAACLAKHFPNKSGSQSIP